MCHGPKTPREALGERGCLRGPVVVCGVASVEAVIEWLHEPVELRGSECVGGRGGHERVLGKVCPRGIDKMSFSFSPLCSPILEPNLQKRRYLCEKLCSSKIAPFFLFVAPQITSKQRKKSNIGREKIVKARVYLRQDQKRRQILTLTLGSVRFVHIEISSLVLMSGYLFRVKSASSSCSCADVKCVLCLLCLLPFLSLGSNLDSSAWLSGLSGL